ncbi:unnamed protein product [Discosporangium mesarthrocarpum]
MRLGMWSAHLGKGAKLGASWPGQGKDRERAERDKTFRQRLNQHQQRELLYELQSDGSYEMRAMTVREAFQYVEDCVAPYAVTCSSPGGRGIRRASSNAGISSSSIGLHNRDMRKLFGSQAVGEPSINVRRNVILVNIETLRGIVLVDRLILVVDTGADSILMEVRKGIAESVEDIYEFELKALEALLSVSSKRLEKEVRQVEAPVKKIVDIMEGPGNAATSAENNDKFRSLTNRVNELVTRAKARKRALLLVRYAKECCWPCPRSACPFRHVRCLTGSRG